MFSEFVCDAIRIDFVMYSPINSNDVLLGRIKQTFQNFKKEMKPNLDTSIF